MLTNFKLIDLTHELSENIPSWSGDCGFKLNNQVDYKDCNTKTKFQVQDIIMNAGIGTHMDAPSHCFAQKKDISSIELDQLFVPAVIIDVSNIAHENFILSVKDIKNLEEKHGKIPEKSFVIVYTGWDKYWPIKEKYHNNYKYPVISKEAAEELVNKNIVGLGIDTLSPDKPDDIYPVHEIILGSGKYIIENIANANKLPTIGSYIIALPLKIKNGTESPIRLIGLTPK